MLHDPRDEKPGASRRDLLLSQLADLEAQLSAIQQDPAYRGHDDAALMLQRQAQALRSKINSLSSFSGRPTARD